MKRDIFQALSDPTRRAILMLIAVQSMTPNNLAEHFNITRQGVSKHIKVLSECNILIKEKVGREIYYNINFEKIKEFEEWLLKFRTIMEIRFNQLDELLSEDF